MPFEFKKTEIEGLMLIKPHMYPDERGLYKKYYEKNIFVSLQKAVIYILKREL